MEQELWTFFTLEDWVPYLVIQDGDRLIAKDEDTSKRMRELGKERLLRKQVDGYFLDFQQRKYFVEGNVTSNNDYDIDWVKYFYSSKERGIKARSMEIEWQQNRYMNKIQDLLGGIDLLKAYRAKFAQLQKLKGVYEYTGNLVVELDDQGSVV